MTKVFPDDYLSERELEDLRKSRGRLVYQHGDKMPSEYIQELARRAGIDVPPAPTDVDKLETLLLQTPRPIVIAAFKRYLSRLPQQSLREVVTAVNDVAWSKE